MLIKKPDDQSAHLAELEARAKGRSAEAKRAETNSTTGIHFRLVADDGRNHH